MPWSAALNPFLRFLPFTTLLFAAGCLSSDRPTAPLTKPEFAISDAVHEGGMPGFYFLPPMVAQPTFSGTFDADITTLNPAIAICDITNGLDNNCGGTGGTPAVILFTTTSTPAITVDLTTPQYQLNWDTKGAGFVTGHTYRLHVAATSVCSARRDLGFADVLLTTTSGQVKFLQTSDIIVLQDGRTLPIHLRIETGAVGNCWTTVAPMPAARHAAGGSVVNDVLYVVGGYQTAATYAYNPAQDAWAIKAPIPTARTLMGVAAVNGILYAVAGHYSNGTGLPPAVEAYDPATDTWVTRASIPTPRADLAAATINGVLYAVGGAGGVYDATVEAYDPATDTWGTKASMPTARAGLGVAAVNGILYAVGGYNQNGNLATLEAYNPATDSWTTNASMPTARGQLSVAVVNGILYAIGGNAPSCNLATVEAYDPSTDQWTTKASMLTGRSELVVGAIKGVVYAAGGCNSNGQPLATNEAYHP